MPPTVQANCRLAGEAASVACGINITATASLPVAASTWMVIRPVKVAGKVAVIEVLLHAVVVNCCEVVEPAGVAVTLQPLH